MEHEDPEHVPMPKNATYSTLGKGGTLGSSPQTRMQHLRYRNLANRAAGRSVFASPVGVEPYAAPLAASDIVSK